MVSHGLRGCKKKTIKNKLVAIRCGEVTIYGESGLEVDKVG
jgi:hypothetical protein